LVEGHSVLHLETYGSESRDRPGKISQAMDLDEHGALELQRILQTAFPKLR
jgi:hypothetical protein